MFSVDTENIYGKLSWQSDINAGQVSEISQMPDVKNPDAFSALYISSGGYSRVFFGRPDRNPMWAVNFNYVVNIEDVPPVYMKTTPDWYVGDGVANVSAIIGGAGTANFILYPGNWDNFLSSGMSPSHMRSLPFRAYAQQGDGKERAAAFIFAHQFDSGWNKPHTKWSVGAATMGDGLSIMELSMDGTLTSVVRAPDARGHVIKGAQGQTANLQEWVGSNGSPLAAVDPQGNVGVGTSTPGAKLHVAGNSRLIRMRIGRKGSGKKAVAWWSQMRE